MLNMNISSLLALGYYTIINIILFIGFYYVRRYEYLFGSYSLEEPHRIFIITLYFILFVLKVVDLNKAIQLNKKNKYIFFN